MKECTKPFLSDANYDRKNNPPGGGGAHPYKRLLGMCHWMGSHFHDWIDYHGGRIFNSVTRIGSHIF